MKKYVFESLKFFCAAILCTILSAFTSPSWGACNLFHIEPQTLNGVTLTMRDDGAYVLNGTCNYNGNFLLGPQSLGAGTYTLALIDRELAPDMAGTQVQAYSQSDIGTNMVVKMDSGENYVTRTFDTDYNDVLFRIRIQEGITYDNYVIKPMFVKGATVPTEYTPYNPLCATCDGTIVNYVSATGTVSQAGTPTPDNPIYPTFYKQGDMVLRKVGDYADTYDASAGKITRRVGVKVLDGTEGWSLYVNRYVSNTIDGTARDAGKIISSHFEGGTNGVRLGSGNGKLEIFQTAIPDLSTAGQLRNWLAEQYAAGTPVMLYYPLAEETTEDWPASYCETPIKIATTKYNETAFSPLNTALANAISVVDTVVSNTITQAASIATLQAQKQTRPNDIADDNEKCSAGKKCLLVEDASGIPHWYEIVERYSRLPDGYTELQWIESTGTQYIDTGWKITQPNIAYDLRYQITNSSNQRIAGCQAPGYSDGATLLGNGWIFSNKNNTSVFSADTNVHSAQFVCSNNECTYTRDAETMSATLGTFVQNDVNFALFGILMGERPSSYAQVKIYHFKIYDNGVLVRDFVPAKRGDVVGMYDTVSGTFFTNAGSGTFIAGNPVSE